MAVSTLAAELAKLKAGEQAGISDLGVRDRVILNVVSEALGSSASLASGKINVGNASNVPTAVTVSGVVTLAASGATAFASNVAGRSASDSNGEIAITGVTSNSGVIVLAQESLDAVHVVPAAGKITVYEAGTTNVVAAKSFAWIVVK
jgi:hypothetical protein